MDSLDASYDLMLMGLWTWAEITTGMLISCLPVMPKFMQNVRPKISRAFSSTSGSSSNNKPEFTVVSNRTKHPSKPIQRPPLKNDHIRVHTKTLTSTDSDLDYRHDQYIELSETEDIVLDQNWRDGRGSVTPKRTTVHLQDLESGSCSCR